MPARSKAQRRLFAIAEHHPDELPPKYRRLDLLTHQQLHDFAATPEAGLPQHKPLRAAARKAAAKGKR